jgi:hypothetical protein
VCISVLTCRYDFLEPIARGGRTARGSRARAAVRAGERREEFMFSAVMLIPIVLILGGVAYSVLYIGNMKARIAARGVPAVCLGLDGRLMFANAVGAQYDLPWVVVTKIEGDLAQPSIAVAHGKRLLIATNVAAVNMDDAEATARNTQAVASGFHMLKDDLPFMIDGRSYFLQLPDGSPGCNAVTATAACDAATLEP